MSKIDTICVQGAYNPKSGDPRVLPLYQSTTFYYETTDEMAHLFDVPKDGHIYSRISNPTTACFEEKMAMLEGGVGAMAAASGMSAIMLAVMNVANAGDNIICLSTVYGGTYNLFGTTFPKFGIETRFVLPDASAEEIEELIDDRTKLVFAESIANPAMVICDFDKYSAVCKKHGLLFMVDNTLATPVLLRPFEFGANVVIHSTTKYIDGHAQSVGGVIVDGGNFDFRGNTRYADFYTPDPSYHGTVYVDEGGAAAFILKARMQYMRDTGMAMSPFTAYLLNLGTETLHLRMERISSNALKVAVALCCNPNVEWVSYAGLPDDKNYALGKKYFKKGFGGMLVIGVRGTRENASAFINSLQLIKQVTHIADVRSCVLHPASTTHRQLSEQALLDCGITPTLVRLSIGIEDVEDIVEDIEQALSKACQ